MLGKMALSAFVIYIYFLAKSLGMHTTPLIQLGIGIFIGYLFLSPKLRQWLAQGISHNWWIIHPSSNQNTTTRQKQPTTTKVNKNDNLTLNDKSQLLIEEDQLNKWLEHNKELKIIDRNK